MSKNSVELGGLYAIPSTGEFAIAKVIFAPKDFRNVVLIRLHQKVYASLSNIAANFLTDDDGECFLYYTGDAAIKAGNWHYLGKESISNKERGLTKRIIGGSVWIEDNHIGAASDSDFETIAKMDVYPYKLVEKIVSKLSERSGG